MRPTRRESDSLARRPLLRSALLAITILGLAACDGGQAGDVSRDDWLRSTAGLLDQPVQASAEDGALHLLLPSVEGDDVYATAVAVSALGPDAEEVIDSLDEERVIGRFHDAIEEERLEETVGGALFTAREIVEADAAADFLEDEHVEALRRVIDDSLDDPREDPLPVDANYLLAIAERLGHRTDDAVAYARQVGEQLGTDICGPDAHPLERLIALATPELELGCDDDAVTSAWDEAASELPRPGQATPDAGLVGLGECQTLYWLADSREDLWPDDDARRSTLVDALGAFEEYLEFQRVSDLLPCLASLQAGASMLGAELAVPSGASGYVTSVLSNGGEPQQLALQGRSASLLLDIARILDVSLDVPEQFLAAQPAAAELALRAAREGDASPALLDEVAADEPSPPQTEVLIEAMAIAGDAACDSGEGLARAEDVLAEAGSSAQRPEGLSYVTVAQAHRVLDACGREPGDGLRESLAGTAASTLEDDEDTELGLRFEAAATMCALDPDALPSGSDFWDEHADEAARLGGVTGSDGVVSVDDSAMLLKLVVADRDGCEARGVLGWDG